MNIYAEYNDEVIFTNPNAGYRNQQELAAKHLTLGKIYRVEYTDVSSYYTSVYLQEIKGVGFNSVLFEDNTTEEPTAPYDKLEEVRDSFANLSSEFKKIKK